MVAAASAAGAAPVQRYPLDARSVYTVRVGTGAPTTVMFPGPVAALDGAGLSAKSEDAPPVLLSHREGETYFSVRALRPDAEAAANVVFRDRVYALVFTAAAEPDRTVTFYEPTGEVTKAGRRRPERLLALLDQAKRHAEIAAQYPALAQRIERGEPAAAGGRGPVTAFFEEVLRFADEDALVFRVRVENRGPAVRFEPAQLGIRIADTVFPAALTDAAGLLPEGRAVRFQVVIVGNPDGSRADLSVRNTFTLALPAFSQGK